ncbi:hypothetical protein VNI00_008776 [Paramarasmius palmivorus]|uniref:Uncharacterized protein n=1 Tax=Paramarasmius palmivorus TaxID=297713 RepID=A0AAW0CTB9_9AGAR
MTLASPRRTPRKAGHPTPGAPKERHCKRCPNRPLLRECAHSAKARKTTVSSIDKTPLASQHSPVQLPVSDPTVSLRPPHPQAYLLLGQNLQAASPTTPTHHSSTNIPVDPALHQVTALQGTRVEQSSPLRPDLPPYTQRRVDTDPFEDIGSEYDNDRLSSPSPGPEASSPVSNGNLTFVNLNSNSARFSSSTPSVSRSGSSRVRVSQKNQPYGRVKGAMRGNLEWNIPRRRSVEPYNASRESRTTQFQRRMSRILQRCEEVANVTGCWLYISSQLATSNHGFVHFASDALIRDADQRMNDLHAFHSNMHTALSRATVRDVAQVEMENVQVRAELTEAKKSEAAARESLNDLQKKLEEQERKMARILDLLPEAGVDVSHL